MADSFIPSSFVLAKRIAARFATLPQVIAFVVAGSLAAGTGDAGSDIDCYCYASTDILPAQRQRIAGEFADQMEIDNRFWEPGDEWMDRATGFQCDIMYRTPAWITDQLDRILVRHEASVGYSTCFWFNVLRSTALYDPTGWYANLQTRVAVAYPEPLRRAIIAKNHPILRECRSSYLHQIESALRRNDPVSVNHRLAALLASYFDILFAVNRQPHPGEKRLVAFAKDNCTLLPEEMIFDIPQTIIACTTPGLVLPTQIESIVNRLDALLRTEGLIS